MSAEGDAIEVLAKQAKNDAEALVSLFSDTSIPDDGTVAGRLRAILKGTEKVGVPGLQTGVEFHDTGFNKRFKDPWPKSDNQVGHFLTAVGLSFNPGKVSESFFGRSLRDWIGAPELMLDDEVARRLIIGHEKSSDPGKGTAIGGWLIAGVLGAATAVLGAFREQFAACTAADVAACLQAEKALGTAPVLAVTAAEEALRGIQIVSTQNGNSFQDLILSLYGYRLGQDISNGKFANRAAVASWLSSNIV